MPITHPPAEPTDQLETTRFWRLATPSLGSQEASVWRVEVQPGGDAVLHEVTREEIFVVLEGTARATLDGAVEDVGRGGAIIVPPHTPFSLAAVGSEPLVALAYLPAGGQARVGNGEPFTPPWAR
jgi:mannose-6-phosphate isomerase-like protein (cupin superfamily)